MKKIATEGEGTKLVSNEEGRAKMEGVESQQEKRCR